jgi:hypothetical protein
MISPLNGKKSPAIDHNNKIISLQKNQHEIREIRCINNFSKLIEIILHQPGKVEIKQVPEQNLVKIKINDVNAEELLKLNLDTALNKIKVRQHSKSPFELVSIISSELKHKDKKYTKILLKADPSLVALRANYIEQSKTIALSITSTKKLKKFKNQVGQIMSC